MGSRLGPIIANIFMHNFEMKHMDNLIKLGVKFWSRFVDDVFVIIKKGSEVEKILDFLNSQHNKIKFTMEMEINKQINFLDIKVKRKNDLKIETSTYRKPTFTGVMLNWNSLTSIRYKTGLI
jgi:reverse gyrase